MDIEHIYLLVITGVVLAIILLLVRGGYLVRYQISTGADFDRFTMTYSRCDLIYSLKQPKLVGLLSISFNISANIGVTFKALRI